MKRIIWSFLAFLTFMVGSAQGFENFDNVAGILPTGADYGDGSFVGNGGITWNYFHCQAVGNYPIDGEGILLRRANEPSKITATITGGIGSFSVDTRKGYTANAPRNLELVINGEVVAQFTHTFPSGESDVVVPFVVNDINVAGAVNLELRMFGAIGNQHLVLDNIIWTGYGESVEPEPTPEYCIPTYATGCGSGDDIDNFVMAAAGINHIASGCSPAAYGDFTGVASLQGTLQRTVTYNFSATHNFSNQYLKIWIDFDNDGEFEASELLFTSASGAIVTTGSITIPEDAPLGNRRMRVMTRYSSAPTDACAPGGNWGETHDYLVQITPAPTCLAPSALSASDVTMSGATLNWAGSGDSYTIEWGPVGFTPGTGTLISNIVGNSYVLSVAMVGAYEFYVTSHCGADDSTQSGPVLFVAGGYNLGDIPTQYENAATVSVNTTNYCTPEPTLTIVVPDGYRIASLQVQYDMTAHNGAWKSEQRSFIYSPTLGAGEATLTVGTGQTSGTMSYNRTLSFANNATGTIDFVLRAWRTWSTFGEDGCTTYNNYVNNNSWILTPTFEPIPTCLEPTGVTLDGLTAYTVDFSWNASGVEEYSWYLFEAGADPLTADPVEFGFTETNSITIYGLTPETSYDFYVTANCGGENGESGYSQVYNFTTLIACPAPTDLGYLQLSLSSAELSFMSEGTVNELKWGEAGFDVDTAGTLVSLDGEYSVILENLAMNAPYEFYVRRDCTDTNDGYSVWVGPFSFYVGYCQPNTNPDSFNFGDYINSFVTTGGITNINNVNNGFTTGYQNFSATHSVSQEAGGTVSFTIAPGSTTYTRGVRIWADFNQDGTFEDNEILYTTPIVMEEPEGTFTIPSSVLPGSYRMRVVLRYGYVMPVLGPCISGFDGEYEDYTLIVVGELDPCADTPAPTADSPQAMTVGQTVADIVVEGENLTWYSDEELTTVVDETTVLEEGSHTFYVTQTIGDCTSAAIEVVVEVTLSTGGFDMASFKAYPNPVKDIFTISYTKNISDVTVVNMLGQVVAKLAVNTTDAQVNMSALPAGNYVVKVTVDGAVQTLKVVKQ